MKAARRTTPRKAKIHSVRIEHAADNSPDTSYLGEYSDIATSEFTIDRAKRGEQAHHEDQYFNPSFNYVNPDGTALMGNTDDDIRKYVEQDYQRMERLNDGDWSYIGIIAKAEVQLPGSDVIQTIRSGGLWGIESDSDAAYLRQVEDEELSNLTAELERLGCTHRQVLAAYENIDRD